MIDSFIIFYLGRLQPVRAGDLLRVVSNPGWSLGGKLFLVMGAYESPNGNPCFNKVRGMVDGRVQVLAIEDLETLDETR